jgi:hypothetical protein
MRMHRLDALHTSASIFAHQELRMSLHILARILSLPGLHVHMLARTNNQACI